MKVQCNCGAKYAFDFTPDMVANPIRLVCNQCGTDISAGVNQIIRQQFGTVAISPPPAPAPVTVAAPARASLRVNVHTAAAPAGQLCLKHPGQFATEHCLVCRKPICPQCMALFGYVCSAFCKSEAESRGIEVPVYANQSAVVKNREWRKVVRIVMGTLGVLALLLGGYAWYLASGSRPRVVFSAKFQTPAYSGSGKLAGPEAVLLHGGYLARYDLKTKKEIWSITLVDTNQIAARTDEAHAEERAAFEEWKKKRTGDDLNSGWVPRSKPEIYAGLLASAQSSYALHVRNSNVWLRSRDKLVQHDWATGKPGKEIALNGGIDRTLLAGNSLLLFSDDESGEQVTKVDLVTGESNSEALSKRPSIAELLTNQMMLVKTAAKLGMTNRATVMAAINTVRTNATPRAPRGTAANPALKGYKVAQPDPLPTRLAAPAIAAYAVRNAQIERALRDGEEILAAAALEASGPRRQFINDHGKLVEFSVKLLEEKTIERQAMKAPPKKSALEGEVNQAATVAIANEIMNEFQREATGGVEVEDVSRYEVMLKRLGNDTTFTSEVIGRPQFFPLETVDLLVAGKSLTVLDKSGKKLWESKLNYEVSGGFGEEGWGELVATATAPGLEHDGHLYFFDEGVLACFELATGNARWRLPTVGVTKILFGDKDVLYVDTTTGSADKLKYSQQIDISDKSYPVILKVDAKSGKPLWRSERNGRLSHVFGKLIYTIEWHGGDEDEVPSGPRLGIEMPPHIRIRRLSAGNGQPKWEYYQKRAPLNVDIEKNMIQLVFKKEMQVLKFIAF